MAGSPRGGVRRRLQEFRGRPGQDLGPGWTRDTGSPQVSPCQEKMHRSQYHLEN